MNNITVGLSRSPAKLVSHETQPITKILVTHGGGMGGTSYDIFGTIISRNETGFFEIATFDGEDVEVNSRYIVSIENKQLLTLVTDITEWADDEYSSTILTEYYIFEESDNINIIDEFKSSNHTRIKSVINTK